MGGLVAGAAVGGGLFLLAYGLVPRPGVEVERMLRRIDRTVAPVSVGVAAARGLDALPERVGSRLVAHVSRLGVARADLEVLQLSPERHLGSKALAGVVGLFLPTFFSVLAALTGVAVPFQASLLVSLAVAAGMWVNADADVRGRARLARVEWRHAVASYLERVRLARAAGAGPEAAMESQAAIGDSPADEAFREALREARVHGVAPWEALRKLGQRVGVPELERPAGAMSRAASGGAPVMEVLATQAEALEDRLTADRQAAANEASETLRLPGTLIFALVLFLMLFPGVLAMGQFTS